MCSYLSACQVTRYLHLVERVVFAQRDFRLMFLCGALQIFQAVHLPYNRLINISTII